MPTESSGLQFTPEKPKASQTEKDLNEIIPILAHGLVRRIEQKGFSGKVKVQALAGNTWGVAKSPDNSTDVPNVIIYPRESLSGDRKLVNARLRHEIGNLNYPIDGELNALRGWCYENNIAPELLTSLVEATHEASVNFLEMQNSHSDRPEENFGALYEQEIDTKKIADNVAQSAPYKQAVDLTLLYSLSQARLVPAEQFEHALASAHPAVQEIFDKQTRSVLDQTVKMAVPKKRVQLVRDFLWPKFSKLVALSGPSQTGSEDEKTKELKREKRPEASARAQQAKEIQKRMQKLMEKMKQKPQSNDGKRSPLETHREEQQKELKQSQDQKPLSQVEQQERKEEENFLAENLQKQLEHAKEQLEKLQKKEQQPPSPQKPKEKTPSMKKVGEQAEQMKKQAEKAMKEAKEAGTQDEITEEQLQKLKKQLEQLEEVAKQIAENETPEKESAKMEEDPITYNIKEYGINESELTSEQLEHLQKIRSFAQSTSKTYRIVMRLLMTDYQQRNPNFTDKMMQKMMERGYDVPDFSIYGSQAAQEFLSEQKELGIDGFNDNFLVNFQLPKPLARSWYKGGSGSRSIPVKDGEIEWGHFYRMAMPVIHSGVDRTGAQGLYMNRLNQFGQHDPKKYYYLWEAINTALENQDSETLKDIQEQLKQLKEKLDEIREQNAEKTEDKNTEKSSEKSEGADNQKQQNEKGGEETADRKSPKEKGQGEEKSESSAQDQKQPGQEQESSEQSENKPSAQELQKQIGELEEQIDQMIQEAEEKGDQTTADELKEMKEQLEQMSEKLEKSEQGEKGESGEQGGEDGEGSEAQDAQPGEGDGQESESPGEGSGEGKGEGEGQGDGSGSGQGQGDGEGSQESAQSGQPGGKPGQGPGQPGGEGGGMPSAQEMQEMLSEMKDMVNQAKEQGGKSGSPGGNQEAADQLLEQLDQMQQSLESGASPQDMAKQMQDAMQKLSKMMNDMEGGEPGQGEGQDGKPGESGEPSESKPGESKEQSHDQFQKGGATHEGAIEDLFKKPDENLLKQLRQAEAMVGSKFSTQDESGNLVARDMSQSIGENLKADASKSIQANARQLDTLDELKRQQQAKMEAMYREMSGLDGEALRVYVDYMESTKDFITDLTEFFINKFKLDKEYIRERNQRRGARLQRGFTQNILGSKSGRTVISPNSFERKRPPEKPQLAWTLIIDNSGSCSGEIIEQEKKLAVALVEVSKALDIPLEVVTFGGPSQFTFLKGFEQDISGDDLQKMVLLHADQGTPDVVTLDAACTSMEKFTDKFRRSYNFVYFMTDGQSGSGSIEEVIKKHKKNMVITGIGMAGAAQTIAQTWGKNAVEVPDVKRLSDSFIRKVEDQIDSTFD